MKNKITIGIIFFLALFLSIFPTLVLADSETNSQNNVKIGEAPVHVHNIKVVSQDQNRLVVGFDVDGSESIQQDLKYSLNLVRVKNIEGKEMAEKAYEKVYDDGIDISPGQSVHKEVELVVPEYLSGEFELWVEIHTEKALQLGAMVAFSKVNLSGTGKYVEIFKKDCFLYVKNEQNQKFFLSQGVDIGKEEQLFLSCEMENKFDQPVTAIPNFSTFYRSIFGENKETKNLDPVFFDAGEKKTVVFEVPKVLFPQAYDTVLILKDVSGGGDVSSRVVAHYVIQGLSATVQNYELDKNDYKEKEIARLRVYTTPSADIFPNGSRGEGTKTDKYILEALIVDRLGNQCSSKYNQEIASSGDSRMEISMPIIIDCPGAKAIVSIKDKNGNFLDGTNDDVSVSGEKYDKTVQKKLLQKVILFVFSVVFLAAVIFHIVQHRRLHKRYVFPKSLLFLVFLETITIVSYLKMEKADAFSTSFTVSGGSMGTQTFNFSSDKDTYCTGGQMVVVSWVNGTGNCYNNIYSGAKTRATINGTTRTMIDVYASWGIWQYDGSYNRSATFSVPSGAGSYTAQLYAEYTNDYLNALSSPPYGTWSNTGSASYTVLNNNPACGSANGGSFETEPSSNLCANGSPSLVTKSLGFWNWTCSTSCGSTACQAFVKINGMCRSTWSDRDSAYYTSLDGGESTSVAQYGCYSWAGVQYGTPVNRVFSSPYFNWICQGSGGGTNSGLCYGSPPAPVVNFTGNGGLGNSVNLTINKGTAVSFSWSSSNITGSLLASSACSGSCQMSWSGSKAASGSSSYTFNSATTGAETYRLKGTNIAGKEVTVEVKVTVIDPSPPSCGSDNNQVFCTSSQITNPCASGSSLALGSMNQTSNEFTWECEKLGSSNVYCEAKKYCSSDSIWIEVE